MGRCSSRVASRRIATNVTKQEESDTESLVGDDSDWGTYKKAKKLKREKHNNSPRGRGRPPVRSQRTEAAGELSCQTVFDNMDEEGRKTLLLNICGAILENPTKKLCTRSVRCSQHTDEQRHAARLYLLTDNKSQADDDIQIDIDTYDDCENQALRDALWERELTPTASPADSTSTVNSSGSRKRGRRKGRRKDK